MTAKKMKENDKLLLENLKVGDTILDLHGEEVEITDDLIEQMRKFEKDSNQNAIWKGKVTGGFLYFLYYEEHPEEKNKVKKKSGRKPKKVEEEIEEVIEESLDEEIEAEVEDEENELLDAMEDYKLEYNVKTVNTKSQKFKRFFYKWKQE